MDETCWRLSYVCCVGGDYRMFVMLVVYQLLHLIYSAMQRCVCRSFWRVSWNKVLASCMLVVLNLCAKSFTLKEYVRVKNLLWLTLHYVDMGYMCLMLQSLVICMTKKLRNNWKHLDNIEKKGYELNCVDCFKLSFIVWLQLQ